MLACSLVLASCKKEGAADATDLPGDLRPRRAAVDPSKLTAPPLFANIPADTPYMIAAFEAVPHDYYAMLKRGFGPVLENAFRSMRALAGDNKLADAVLTELDGKLNAAGLESLGLSTQPRFAIYGLGMQPLVMRFEVKDHKMVQATIERIAQRAGESLPAMETKDGRNFWRITKPDESSFVVALADNQIIAAIGKPADVDAKLGIILGSEKPAASMADGKQLKDLMARHGFGPHFIGFGDVQRITRAALAADDRQWSAACTGEIDRLVAKMPRLVLGYGELTPKQTSGGFVLELSSDLVSELQAIRTELPGFAAAMADQPAFAMGAAIDIVRAQKLAGIAAGALGKLGEVCGIDKLAEGSAKMAAALDRQLPSPIAKIVGGAVSIHELKLMKGSRQPMPEKIEAFGFVASGDAKELYGAITKLQPMIEQLGIKTDGKLHRVGEGLLPLPFSVFAGVGDRLLVVAAGDKGKALAEKVVGARGGGKVPLFAATYDYGKLLALRDKLIPSAAPDSDEAKLEAINADLVNALAKMFGRASGSLDVTDKGLAMWWTIETK